MSLNLSERREFAMLQTRQQQGTISQPEKSRLIELTNKQNVVLVETNSYDDKSSDFLKDLP